ncbi:unnamed protein product [Effrenium voratum]|uniref:RNA helicase n=1 Tax=Effrenium voratum TaxID=2562239 RepID=A0AA36N8Q7_9DINO|nr:unnamed protein product [Effrenium voratum]
MAQEASDHLDLKELEAFMSGSVKPEALPLPPGFEEGPDMGSYKAKESKDPWQSGEDPWGGYKANNPNNGWSADGWKADGWKADGWSAGWSEKTPEAPRPKAAPRANGSANGRPERDQRLVGEDSAKVVIEQEDPSAEYLAVTSWDEMKLPKEILDGIFELGFVRPSKIQEWTLPIALKGGNIIGQARNGSGKTAAFALAMLIAVDSRQRQPQGLCLCPTRELAAQNHDVVSKLGQFTGMDFLLAVPRDDRFPRKVESQIVVGTPGKVQDLMKRRTIEPKGFRVFVVDEADVMIDEVMQVRGMMPENLQVLLFSATWPDHVEKFAKLLVPKANTIKVQKEELTLTTITQTYIDVGRADQKPAQLSDLYGALNIGQSIIFVNTRHGAFELAKMMKSEGHAVSLICGTQKTGPERVDVSFRDRVMGEFRSGVTKVLISTDVLARGIDVPAVTLVVNYDLPMSYNNHGQPDFETYMHRIGRTGRFGLKGVAVNLVSDRDRHHLDAIQSFYKCAMTKLSGDCEEMEGLLKGLR